MKAKDLAAAIEALMGTSSQKKLFTKASYHPQGWGQNTIPLTEWLQQKHTQAKNNLEDDTAEVRKLKAEGEETGRLSRLTKYFVEQVNVDSKRTRNYGGAVNMVSDNVLVPFWMREPRATLRGGTRQSNVPETTRDWDARFLANNPYQMLGNMENVASGGHSRPGVTTGSMGLQELGKIDKGQVFDPTSIPEHDEAYESILRDIGQHSKDNPYGAWADQELVNYKRSGDIDMRGDVAPQLWLELVKRGALPQTGILLDTDPSYGNILFGDLLNHYRLAGKSDIPLTQSERDSTGRASPAMIAPRIEEELKRGRGIPPLKALSGQFDSYTTARKVIAEYQANQEMEQRRQYVFDLLDEFGGADLPGIDGFSKTAEHIKEFDIPIKIDEERLVLSIRAIANAARLSGKTGQQEAKILEIIDDDARLAAFLNNQRYGLDFLRGWFAHLASLAGMKRDQKSKAAIIKRWSDYHREKAN